MSPPGTADFYRWKVGRAVCLAAAIALLWPAAAAAQRPYLAITGLRGFVGARGQGNFETTRPEGQESRKLETLVFDERLMLSTRGFIYDPALVFFDVGGEFGWVQNSTSVDGDKRDGDGELIGWNVRTAFLRERPYNMEAYTFRTTATQSRDFAGSSETVNEAYGATVNLYRRPINLKLELRQEEIDQDFSFAPTSSRLHERRRIARMTGRGEWQYQDLDFSYEFNRREDLEREQLSFDVQHGDLRHRIMFGYRRDNTLTSSLRVLDSDGSFDALSILTSESLQLTHTRSLSSYYNYVLTNLDREGSTTRTHSGSARLHHQLYESLTTSVGVNGSTSSLPDGSITSYGPVADIAYRKRIPLSGTVSAGIGLNYRVQDQDVPGGIASVFQEAHTFADLTPVQLDASGALAASIVVTDVTGTILYDEGVDYFVREFGNSVEIERNPLGSIPAGATVLVTYDYQVAPELKYSELTSHYGARLDFPWVAVFYTHARSDVRLLKGDNVGDFIEDVRSHRAGFELRTAAGRRLTASALQAYEQYRSDRLSYDVFEFTQILSYMLRRDTIFSLTAGESLFDFEDPARETEDYYVRALLSWLPLPSVSCEAFGGLRDQRDSLSSDYLFIEGGVRSRVRIGKFDLDAAYTHVAREIGSSESDGDSFRFGITRWFGR